MNNLKRVLSLTLASVMLVGTMVVGASAKDFTDAADIQHDEAVNVLVALGIVGGMEDGSYFAPKANVTRAQMAKMIAVAMLGGNDVKTGVKSTPSFTDIKGHWAESYIEYCFDMGIISGRGDSTFDPDSNVTGTEVTKMVLTALGYDAKAYNLTGPSWATQTQERARRAKPSLFEELDSTVTLAQPASRDTAVQIIWNGLQNVYMEYNPIANKSTGGLEWSYGANTKKETLLKQRYGADIFVGTMEGNKDTGNATNDGEIVVEGKIEGSSNNVTSASFPSNLSIDNIGEEVKVIFKDSTSGNKNQPDKKDTIFGVFNTGATNVVNATLGDIKDGDDAPSAKDKVKIGSTEYTVAEAAEGDVVVVNNYGATDSAKAAAAGTASVKAAIEGAKATDSKDTVKFVCNDDGKIFKAYVTNYYMSYVTAVSSTKVTINGLGSIKIADNDVYEGIAKNDIVVYTKLYKKDAGDAFVTVKKAESVTGTLTSYKIDGTLRNVVIDGTTYKIDRRTAISATVDGEASKAAGDLTASDVGESFTIYLMNGTAKFLFKDSRSVNNLAVVKAVDDAGLFDSTFKTPRVELVLGDGSTVNATIHKDSVLYKDTKDKDGNVNKDSTKLTSVEGNNKIQEALAEGDLVRYTVRSNNQYELVEVVATAHDGYSLKTAKSDGTNNYVKDTKVFTVGGESFVTDGSAKLFVKQTVDGDTDWKVYDVRSLGDVAGTSDKAVKAVVKDGKVLAAFLELGGRPSGAAGSRVYGIVSAFNGITKVDGDSYKSYTMENDQETYKVYLPTGSEVISAGDLVSFEPANDNVYNDNDITVYNQSAANWVAGAVKATWVKDYSEKDQTLTYYTQITKNGKGDYTAASADTKTVALDDKCVIVYVNTDGDEAGNDIGINEFTGTTGYRNVLLIADDTTTKVVAIIVESSGDADILDNTSLKLGEQTGEAFTATTGESVTYDVTVTGTTNTPSVKWYTDNTYKTSTTAPTNATAAIKDGKLTISENEGVNIAAGPYYFQVEVTTENGDTLTANGTLDVAADA